MSTIKTPTNEEIHAWGLEIGAEAGRSLASEADAFIGMTTRNVDTPDALQTYGGAFLRAFIRGYRTELTRLLGVRGDIDTNANQTVVSKQRG